MMIKKNLFKSLLLIYTALAFACEGQSGKDNYLRVSGKIENPQNGIVRLIKLEPSQQVPLDTLEVAEDGSFSFSLEIDQPNFYQINFYNRQVATLILHEDDLQIVADGSNPKGRLDITGSKDMEYFQKLIDLYEEQNQNNQAINSEFMAARQEGNADEMERLQEKYLAEQEAFKDKVKALVGEMGNSIAVLQAMNFMNAEEADDFKIMVEVANNMNKSYPNSPLVKQFVEQVEAMKSLAVGATAPNFELDTPEGEKLSLTDLRGQYVLVDFWAAWCRPCRVENPNVVEAYQKFNDKGFTVLGVSLDRKKEDWLKAIQDDNLTWHHVSDLKYWQSDVVPLYGIKGIPFSVLLDKEGKIIAKNLRGKKLHEKLEEVLN